MPILEFSKNWNRKLDCDHYTTIRLDNPAYRKNELYTVWLNRQNHHRAVCIDRRTLKLSQVNDWIAILDSGMNKSEFIDLMFSIYAKIPDLENRDFCLLLMKKTR